jgi:hypothetical protein
MICAKRMPEFSRLRKDPRFEEILVAMGLEVMNEGCSFFAPAVHIAGEGREALQSA